MPYVIDQPLSLARGVAAMLVREGRGEDRGGVGGGRPSGRVFYNSTRTM